LYIRDLCPTYLTLCVGGGGGGGESGGVVGEENGGGKGGLNIVISAIACGMA